MFYETAFIVRQDLSASQVESLTAELVKIIKDKKGKMGRQEYWGLRNLAYKIKKNRKGHYGLLNYTSEDPTLVETLEKSLRYNEDILRFMTIRTEKLETEPSIMMKSSDEDESRSAA